MPKNVGTFILVTDHGREQPGMMGKQNVYPDHGVLFSRKKEWSTDTCCNVDELGKCYAKWKKAETKGRMLYGSIYMKCPG